MPQIRKFLGFPHKHLSELLLNYNFKNNNMQPNPNALTDAVKASARAVLPTGYETTCIDESEVKILVAK